MSQSLISYNGSNVSKLQCSLSSSIFPPTNRIQKR